VEPGVARAVVRTLHDAEPLALLEEVLHAGGLWSRLEAASAASGRERGALHIAIKPDLEFVDRDSPTGTDPALVEHLIDLLHDHGFEQVVVCDGPGFLAGALENRDVLVLADLVGYRWRTPKGRSYEVIDLSDDTVTADFPKGSVLAGSKLGRAWVEADFRIVFAKNKTHPSFSYALALQSLLTLLPGKDKDYQLRCRWKPWDCAPPLLRAAPVHFALIDAVVSSHGSAGSHLPRALATHTLIAGDDLLLCDLVAALKMGLDPHASPINAAALRETDGPVSPYRIEGDLAPYEGWRNPHPLVSGHAIGLGDPAALDRWLEPLVSAVDEQLFPFKRARDAQLHRLLEYLVRRIDDQPAVFWLAAWARINAGLALAAVDAWRTLFAKEELRQRELPVGFDPGDFGPDDYEAIEGYLEGLERLVAEQPRTAAGLRWCALDESVVFEFSRTLPVPYPDFVKRVDVSQAVQLMNDYLGGGSVVMRRDERGRAIHRATRTVYLPQPNFLVLYGGKPIDVSKLELVRYGEREEKVYWRTIHSLNDSAEFDDGSVAFADRGDAGTEVVIRARQKFELPPVWQMMRLDLNPALKAVLVDAAYQDYFEQTIANFEARYEGRPFRIGRAWPATVAEYSVEPYAESVGRAVRFAERLGRAASWALRGASRAVAAGIRGARPESIGSDAQGFRHFPGRSPSAVAATQKRKRRRRRSDGSELEPVGRGLTAGRDFVREVAEAMRSDLGLPGAKR
jgi:uncharacterized protein (DUF362 family)